MSTYDPKDADWAKRAKANIYSDGEYLMPDDGEDMNQNQQLDDAISTFGLNNPPTVAMLIVVSMVIMIFVSALFMTS